MVRPWSWCISFLSLGFLVPQMQTTIHPTELWEGWHDLMHLHLSTSGLVQIGCSESIYFLLFPHIPRLADGKAYIRTQVFVKPKVNSLQQLHTSSYLGLGRTRTRFYFTRVKFAVSKSGPGLSNTSLRMWEVSFQPVSLNPISLRHQGIFTSGDSIKFQYRARLWSTSHNPCLLTQPGA